MCDLCGTKRSFCFIPLYLMFVEFVLWMCVMARVNNGSTLFVKIATACFSMFWMLLPAAMFIGQTPLGLMMEFHVQETLARYRIDVFPHLTFFTAFIFNVNFICFCACLIYLMPELTLPKQQQP